MHVSICISAVYKIEVVQITKVQDIAFGRRNILLIRRHTVRAVAGNSCSPVLSGTYYCYLFASLHIDPLEARRTIAGLLYKFYYHHVHMHICTLHFLNYQTGSPHDEV